MDDELHAIWRDDCLIEAAARGDLHHTAGAADAAAGPLCALARVADARPLPRLDVDLEALVDGRHSHRYAVRSLAVAVAAVATLSTSGVAAVVTGDPFRPAKAVWHEIQDHAAARSHTAGERLHSGAALSPPVEGDPVADVREVVPEPAVLVPDARHGQTAHAPRQAVDAGADADGRPTPDAGGPADDAAADDTTAGEREENPAAEDAEGSTEREPQQDSTEEEGDDQQATEPPDAEQQPAPDDEPDDDGLDPLVLPRGPEQTQEQYTPQVPSAEGAGPADDDADQEPLLSEPAPTTEPTGETASAYDDGLQP